MKIRQYKNEDYKEISNWAGTIPEEILSTSSTFVLEIGDKLAFALTVYFTNCKEICFLDNFVGNPELKEERKQHTQALFTYIEGLAKELGYKRIVCFANIPQLINKYETFGYKTIMNDTSVLGKGL